MAVHHCHLKANGDWKGGASAPKAPPLNPPLHGIQNSLFSDTSISPNTAWTSTNAL